MNHGRITQVGSPADIYESPATRFVADFIGSVNMFEGRVSDEGSDFVRIECNELGCAVLVIEHDMPLLMALCDRVYALDSGRVIAEGVPEVALANPAVIEAYLGSGVT